MKITASEVNRLRQATGAGMMDCKKALVEAEGDFEKAVENLRKKGQKVAANRADRDSSEGAVLAKVNQDNTSGVIVSINCETDFVAKNETYLTLAKELTDTALGHETLESFLAADFKGMSVAEKLTEQTGEIGEKIEIGDFKTLKAPEPAGFLCRYSIAHGSFVVALAFATVALIIKGTGTARSGIVSLEGLSNLIVKVSSSIAVN